jgi:hypothetical protein
MKTIIFLTIGVMLFYIFIYFTIFKIKNSKIYKLNDVKKIIYNLLGYNEIVSCTKIKLDVTNNKIIVKIYIDISSSEIDNLIGNKILNKLKYDLNILTNCLQFSRDCSIYVEYIEL